jgi:hypothetical protein
MKSEGARHVEAREIEHEIECLRSELGGLVHELDRRRHEAVDVRLQIRRHPRAVALALSLVALTIVGRFTVLRRRRADTLRTRAVNLVRALALLSEEDPERVRRALQGRANPSALGALARTGAAIVRARLGAASAR